ncbi:MAG: F0F1 ATP synthase subunit A [Actinobacteria bacterium]|nr:F0F1 ATP synthase subunit A [Actinomycetota bacterium]
MNSLVLAAEGGGFHVPELEELFEWPAFWWSEGWRIGPVPLEFNRTAMLIFISVAIISTLMVVAFRKPRLVPTKFQLVMESIVQFIRENIVMEVVGPAGLRFVPFLTALFLFIWFQNLYEILPGVNFPTTSRMALPAFFAFVSWTIFILVGIREQGLRYFKNVAIPSGVPWWVLPLYVPIEIVSVFIVRPLTLAVRLFANMMAGHIILAVIFIATNAFLFDVNELSFNLKGAPIGIVAFAMGPLLVAFELLVGVLQAYIFTILTAVYIGGALHPEH